MQLAGSTILDIGCGAGYSSLQIAQQAPTALVVGVDIDLKLVSKARRIMRSLRAASASCAAATPTPRNGHGSSGGSGGGSGGGGGSSGSGASQPAGEEAAALDCLDAGGSLQGVRMPLSMPMDHGPIPAGGSSASRAGDSMSPPAAAPPPCLFRVGDVLSLAHCRSYASSSVDAVFALNVTKWLHLQGGDAGVLQFFHFVFRVLRPGGVLVIQPQRRGSYDTPACRLGPTHVPASATPRSAGSSAAAALGWAPTARGAPWRQGHSARAPSRSKWPLRYDMHVPPEEFPKLLLQGVGFHSVRRVHMQNEGGGRSTFRGASRNGAPMFIATKAAELGSAGYAPPSPTSASALGGGAKRPRPHPPHSFVDPPVAPQGGVPASSRGSAAPVSAAGAARKDSARGAWRLGPTFAQQPQVPVKCRDGWGGEPT